ncbi:CAP domain-containing protein [Cnuella takakiae]|nr:CAP domain-containing protein [Cnuella takakiae]
MQTIAGPGPGPKTSGPEPLNKTGVLRLVNEIRSKGCQCGDTWYGPAAPLLWNDQLEAAAQSHSDDMFTRKYFAHRSPEGKNAGFRIEQAGYKWMSYGENIGMGYRDEAEVVNAWKGSPSHCKNLMNANFKEMGVARNGQYWTQTFGKK